MRRWLADCDRPCGALAAHSVQHVSLRGANCHTLRNIHSNSSMVPVVAVRFDAACSRAT